MTMTQSGSGIDTINWRSFDYYPALRRVKDYTEQNYHRKVPLKAAAEVARMESTYFSSFFHRKVGVRYLDWLRYLRVSKAMLLLASESRTITEISYQVGFDDLRTFQRAFKHITAMTPRAFKRMCRPA